MHIQIKIKIIKAQDSPLKVGGGLTYASDISTAGLFIKGNYTITNQWEAAADFNYFFPKNYGFGVKFNWMALNFNAHYIFHEQEPMTFYGIGGLNILMIHIPSYTTLGAKVGSTTDSNIGLNLGAGGRYKINDKLSGLGEVKFVVGNASYLQLNVGILYNL